MRTLALFGDISLLDTSIFNVFIRDFVKLCSNLDIESVNNIMIQRYNIVICDCTACFKTFVEFKRFFVFKRIKEYGNTSIYGLISGCVISK